MVPPAAIICLLDDEPSVLKAVGRLLASEGLQSLKFSEPARFLEYALRHSVRLAVIDIQMPGMTGLEVMNELRASSPGTRIIIVTGESDPRHRGTALARGASAFFHKPFGDEAFLHAVREALGHLA